MKAILQNDFKRQWGLVEPKVLQAVRRVGSSGWYILGQEVEAFERALSRFWGFRHGIGVANGMDAIEIALRALRLRPGDEVLTSPLSAFATTLAIMRAGAIPVFVDVDDLGLIDLRLSRQALERNSSLRFFLPVHLYGFALARKPLLGLKRDFNLQLVEDCAQAIGAKQDGSPVGLAGQVSCTSFYPTKNLGAFGDGGALLTNNAALAAKAKALRNYGQTRLYEHAELGLNSRLDELHAAILTQALLPHLPRWMAARCRTAQRYLSQIRHPLIHLPAPGPAMEPVWHLFPLRIKDGRRAQLQEHLLRRGIHTGIHYPSIIPEQKALRAFGCFRVVGKLSQARRFAAEELSLPIHPFLTAAEVDAVIAACNEWRP